MAFNGLYVTNKGLEALTKAQKAGTLSFVGMAIGDGKYSGSPSDIRKLVNTKTVLNLVNVEIEKNVYVLAADLNNHSLPQGFYLREIGILAKDGDDTILYAYTNAGNDAEYIPASGGATMVEKRIRISLVIDNVSEVNIEQGSTLYVTQEEFEKAKKQIEQAEENISKITDSVQKILTALENVLSTS